MYVSAPSAPTFDNIIALNGKDARAYLDRAYTHLFNGDYDGAETDYRRKMRLDPSDEDVKQKLAGTGRVLCTMSVPNCRHTTCKSPIIARRIE